VYDIIVTRNKFCFYYFLRNLWYLFNVVAK